MISKSYVNIDDVEVPYFYLTGREDVLNYFKGILKQDSPERLSIDLETYPRESTLDQPGGGLVPLLSKIRTLQVYNSKKVVILDFLNPEDGSYLLSDKEFAKTFYDFLLHANELIAHNALFETAHIQRVATAHGIWNCRLHIYCTMNMWRLYSASKSPNSKAFGSSLKKVAKNLFDYEAAKEEQLSDWSKPELTSEQLDYCAIDAVLPYFIFCELKPKLEEENLLKVFELNTRAQEPVASMHLHGMSIDADKHSKLMKVWKEEAEKAEKECYKLLNSGSLVSREDLPKLILNKVTKKWHEKISHAVEVFFSDEKEVTLESLVAFSTVFETKVFQLENTEDKEKKSRRTAYKRVVKNIKEFLVEPSSSKQLSDWIEENIDESLIIDWPTTEKIGLFKTDAEALKEHAEDAGLEDLLNYKHYSKLYSTYGVGFKKFFISVGERTIICPNFSLCLTETGRMSSFKPAMQTLPRDKELRSIFIPRSEEYKLLVADFSQIEVRLAAYWSQDKVMLRAYRDGVDIHRLTSATLARKLLEEVSDEERQAGKAIVFGLLFGAGAETLRKYAKKSYGVILSQEEAERAVATFRETYPEFRAWQQRVAKQAEKSLVTKTKLGKVRKLDRDYTYTVSMNMPIQGTAAEIMLQSLINVHEVIWKKGFDARIVNCVHDEIIVESHNGHVEEVAKVIETEMTRAMKDVLEIDADHPLLNDLVECGVGSNWSESKI